MHRPVSEGIFRASLELSLGLGQKKDDGECFFNSLWLEKRYSLLSAGLPTKAPREGFKQHYMPKHRGICLLASLLL